jgi:tetratricopeptide (TPR) repeat protein
MLVTADSSGYVTAVMAKWVEISESSLGQIRSLIDDGKPLSAWNLAGNQGPLSNWAPGEALHQAGRLAIRLGNDRLGRALQWFNWRHDRNHPEFYYHALFSRWRTKAPVLLLPEIRAKIASLTPSGHRDTRADLLAIEAWILATVRDFSQANASMRQALDSAPTSAWLLTQQASVWELEDRYDEALESAREALRVSPNYRPAVLQAADSLVHLGLDDEAIELLRKAHQATEESAFALRLQSLYSEREDHANGLWYLDEAEARMPLVSPAMSKWIEGRRADFLYQANDFAGCLKHCDGKNEGYHKLMAEQLRRPGAWDQPRRKLEVPFIRQHNMTCAPATLASLAKFWGRDHEHLAIAAEICHEGTPWHKERGWAEANGFIAKEFRFTREILVALIDRGIPFTLTTTAVTSAHLQACIGYDKRCDVVLLRDPTHRHFGEMMIEGLIESHPLQGPRCMMLLPCEEAARLDGLHFPDEALYEARHHFSLAKARHDRWKAQEAVSTMRAMAPEHPLTRDAESDLAVYLGHYAKALQINEDLLKSFPDHEPLYLRRVHALRQTGDLQATQATLHQMVGRQGCDPVFVSELGEMLLEDARRLPWAGYYLRRAMRIRPGDGSALESFARWHLKAGDFPRAAALRRHASTASPAWEPYAEAYFESCRSCGQIDEGLRFLADRCGTKSSGPWLTHASALQSVGRAPQAKAVLERALQAFAEDGELKLRAARLMIFWGGDDRPTGFQWIEESRSKVAEGMWLRQAASAAVFAGDRPRAIRLWRELLRLEPLAIDGYESLPRLIAEEQGRLAAIEFLRQATAQHPRHPALWRIRAQWEQSPSDTLPVLDRILEMDPDDHWARRERAEVRWQTGDHGGGLADAEEAVARDPFGAESHGVLAMLLHRQGRNDEARHEMREALKRRIDYTFGIAKLMEWSVSTTSRQETVAFVEAEMHRQVSNGDCVPEYQSQAWRVLPPSVLLERLQGFCRERPDLWQTWAARLDHALRMDRLDEAERCASHLRTAFPLMPRTWMEQAKVRRAAGDKPGELEAFRKTMELSPGWDWAARQFSEALERAGQFVEAEQVLREAVQREPLNCTNHGLLADLLLKLGKKTAALDCLRRAVEMGPYYSWGWTTLARLSRELGQEESFREPFNRRNESQSKDPEWWLVVAELQDALNDPEAALIAIRNGLALAPAHAELMDRHAITLCALGRYEDALAACEPAENQADTPVALQGRRAWVRMESGNGPAAIREMQAVLEKDPTYGWGWGRLASWHDARSDWKSLAASSEQWTRFCPDQAVAHAHLAVAAEELKDLPKAKLAYQRAYLLDPAYLFAGRKLLSLQMEAGEFILAAETLASLRHFSPGVWTEYDAVQLTLARKLDAQALEQARQLALQFDDGEALDALTQAFFRKNLGPRWLAELQKMIDHGELATAAGVTAWVQCVIELQGLQAAERGLRRFKIPEPVRNVAWEPLLRAAARQEDGQFFNRWRRRHHKRFHRDPNLWNVIGELLLIRRERRVAARWLRDWGDRPDDVGAHTHVNLSAALDGLARPAMASTVRAAGISRFPRERNSLALRAAEASWLAAKGRIEEAAEILEPVEDVYLSEYYLGLASLARSVIAAAAGNENDARHHHGIALNKLLSSSASPSVKLHFLGAEKELAKYLPWTKGRRGRLRKQWGEIPFQRWNAPLSLPAIAGLVVVIVGLVILVIATGFSIAPLIFCIFALKGILLSKERK